MRYRYLGDRMTREDLRGADCDPVLRRDGKCIVGGSKQLVRFAGGEEHVVLRRRLRLRSKQVTPGTGKGSRHPRGVSSVGSIPKPGGLS